MFESNSTSAANAKVGNKNNIEIRRIIVLIFLGSIVACFQESKNNSTGL